MEEQPTRIICDTNIWYDLSRGTIHPSDVQGKRLVGTCASAVELGASFVLLRDYKLFRGAVIAFKTIASELVPETPPEYMKMISRQKSYSPLWGPLSTALDVVVENEEMPLKEGTLKYYEEYRDGLKDTFNALANFIEEYRSRIVDPEKHREILSSPERRTLELERTKETILTEITHSNTLDWSKLELFLKTFDEWLFQLSIDPKMKMKPSDFHDLMMLAYVEPNSFYWTSDEGKTKRFIKLAGCEHYLYNP